MLHDGDPGAEQGGVRGPGAVRVVIDVEGVDAHERGARRDQVLRRVAGEERMARPVPLGPPMRIPPGVYQHGLTPDVVTTEPGGVERAPRAPGRADHDSF